MVKSAGSKGASKNRTVSRNRRRSCTSASPVLSRPNGSRTTTEGEGNREWGPRKRERQKGEGRDARSAWRRQVWLAGDSGARVWMLTASGYIFQGVEERRKGREMLRVELQRRWATAAASKEPRRLPPLSLSFNHQACWKGTWQTKDCHWQTSEQEACPVARLKPGPAEY